MEPGLPKIESIAIPGLGTGCGGLNPETVATQMWTAFREVILNHRGTPADFDEAQRGHLDLNPKEIMIWD